jgi:Arylsulfotransferase (ASST)
VAAAPILLTTAPAALATSGPAVAVYPSPGTRYNLPDTQITFRGIPASQIGNVTVVGSSTGVHTGQIEADSDGNGGSFLSNAPFQHDETVTVTTSLNVIGGNNGTFSFKIEHPSWPIKPMPLPVVPAGANGLQHFRSRPDLLPPSVVVSRDSAPASEGDIFVAPQFGPAQNGPMILDPRGQLVWFSPFPVSQKTLVADFRVQQLYGQPVLTWWQGYTNHGTGVGEGVILDQNYQQLAVVKAGNGLQMDLHEFLVTPQGQAYLIGFSPVSLPNVVHKPLLDCVIQEIDIKTGLVMFEWHALDHIPIADSDLPPSTPGFVYDPYHANSVGVDSDGNLIISMRDTSAVYKVNRETGNVMWELGGKHSSFRMGPGTSTAFQHDAVVQPDGTVTIFDDGAGPPTVHPYSRGVRVAINTQRMTATLVRAYDHSPLISANFEGSVEDLSEGDVFLGWGQQPYFSEDNGTGQQIFDAHFAVPTSSYRAYRFPWSAQPSTAPAVTLGAGSGGAPELYASWNGATDVSGWRVLAGADPSSLTPVWGAPRTGFETAIAAASEAPYLEVQPLDGAGNVLATSAVLSQPPHVEVYGSSAFVPAGGATGGLPVGCFTGHPCALTTTISSGGTELAHSAPVHLGSGNGTLAYFDLTAAGRRALARATRGHLATEVTVRDSSGARVSAPLNLIRFSTRGAGPRRTLAHSGALSLVGLTDFVNSAGVGGILVRCAAPLSPCAVNASISVGHMVVALTGREYVDAGDLGYVIFTLTPDGQSMLAHAGGNQLAVQAQLISGADTASGQIALVRFSFPPKRAGAGPPRPRPVPRSRRRCRDGSPRHGVRGRAGEASRSSPGRC